MGGLQSRHTAEHLRPLVLVAAFAVVLLTYISATMATSASALSLVDGLRRDLGAVRVQLEQIAPIPVEDPRQSVAFNADVGDGGIAFRHRSMATILRSAKRRIESLVTGYRNADDTHRAYVALRAQHQLLELDGLIHYLGNATDAASITWSQKRTQAEGLLDRMHDALVILLPDPRTLGSSKLG